MKKWLVIFIITLCCHNFIRGDNLKPFFDNLKNLNYSKAETQLSKFKDSDLKLSLNLLLKTLNTRQFSGDTLLPKKTDSNQLKIVKHLTRSYQFSFLNDVSLKIEAFKGFSEALNLSNLTKKDYLTKVALIALLDLLKQEFFLLGNHFQLYLNHFEELKSDSTDDALLVMYKAIFSSKADKNLEVDFNYYAYTKKLDSLFDRISKKNPLHTYYFYEKAIEYKIENQYRKSVIYFKKADSSARINHFLKSLLPVISWQLSDLNLNANNILLAKEYIQKSMSLATTKKDSMYDAILYSRIYAFEKQDDFAYSCIEESNEMMYNLKYESASFLSGVQSEINNTNKIKAEKLEAEAKSKQTTYLLTGALGLLLFGSITFFLIQKNTKRKQLLAEQEKELQVQKVGTLMKEQELTSIDAMIEGQEKERQRIANDLHDDLGGMMATVKLHFNTLKDKPSSELYNKTDKLLDEAYQKVRSIAHAKNSGVIAKEGLLKSIKDMAKKVSTSGKIVIDVVDHGLENRLENSLELTIFRIVQELITNVIKHAEATQTTIHLTNHDNSLNIMVEDNGKGFNPKQLSKKGGMGLNSIDKRIDYLNGKLGIDSEKGKGTTIIIDIPI